MSNTQVQSENMLKWLCLAEHGLCLYNPRVYSSFTQKSILQV